VNLTIGFGRDKGVMGWLKWIILRAEANHCWLEYEGPDLGQPIMIQASTMGVEMCLPKKYEKKAKVVARYRTKFDVPGGYASAVSWMGTKYDYMSLVGAILCLWVWRWFKVEIKNPFASADGVICSELVVRADPAHTIPEWRKFDPERVSPQMLLDVCRREESFCPVVR
jgi:hypothetical protein